VFHPLNAYDDGQRVVLALPQRVPFGFHGNWFAD
jgi:carotenoid cleavage dioxygenase-like enzyme